MTSIILTPSLARKITINANAAVQFSQDSLSKKVQSAANQAFQSLKDFFQCLKQSFKTTLLLSPLNLRVGFSFRAIPVKYRMILSVTLIAITNIFLATIKFFRLPKHKDTVSEQQIYNFLNALLKEEEIEECIHLFVENLHDLLIDQALNPESKIEEISNLSNHFKELLYQTTRNHSLRVLNKESKDVFNRFWNENFREFCQTYTQQYITTFHISTNWEYSLLQHLDPRIVKETVLNPCETATKTSDALSAVNFEIVYEWFDQIDWQDKTSPHYKGAQTDPNYHFRKISPADLKNNIKRGWNFVQTRAAVTGSPNPATDPVGFNKFYLDIETKAKACILFLQQEEKRVQQKMAGQKYENLDEETKKEFRFLCENKGYFCCQLGIAGGVCPGATVEAITRLYTEFLHVTPVLEDDLSLEQIITKNLATLRLEIANQEATQLPGDVHYFNAYMGQIGQPFNVPGTEDIVEPLVKLNKERVNEFARSFSNKYTPNALILEIQNHYKKSQTFREKVQSWIQDRAQGWNQDKYKDLFLTIQKQIAEKLEELENLSVNNHPATDLYINILRNIQPNTVIIVNEETGESVNLVELARRLEDKTISFDDFKDYLLSLEQTKEIIAASEFFKKSQMKHFGFVKNALKTQLKDIDCNEDLAQIAISILQKNESLEQEALESLSTKLTKNAVMVSLCKITSEHGLTNIDFKHYEDDAAIARSLKNAILVKQKSDYLSENLPDDESNVIPPKIAEELLVSYRFLERAAEGPSETWCDRFWD